ncbi:MAG: YdeI/OmpD-associated family protein [Pseudomonadota bacterium]
MVFYPFSFEGDISLHDVGKKKVLTYKVLFMPEAFETRLPFDEYPRLRIEGEIAEVSVRGAWMPVGDGRRYFIVSPEIKKQTGFGVGDRVEMRFRIDDQDYVDIPSELEKALSRTPSIMELWTTLTPGKQRMFAHHIAAAKTAPTRARRVSESLEAIGLGISLRDLNNARKKDKRPT